MQKRLIHLSRKVLRASKLKDLPSSWVYQEVDFIGILKTGRTCCNTFLIIGHVNIRALSLIMQI